MAAVTAGLQPNVNNQIETLKALSDTRSSAHSEATKVLSLNYAYIQRVLHKTTEDDNLNTTTRNETQALHKKMCELETAFLCNVKYSFRETRFQRVSAALQATENDLYALDLIQSLMCQVLAVNLTF